MAAARYNIYWFLSLIVPAVVMLVATYRERRRWLLLGALTSFVATYFLCFLAVQTKWHDRFELAHTHEQLAYATADGANIVFTAFFFAPVEAALYTVFWLVAGTKLASHLKKKRQVAET